MVAFDHEQNHIYLLSFCQPGEEAASEAWLSATAASLSSLEPSAAMDPAGEGSAEPPCCCSAEPSPAGSTLGPEPSASLHLARSHAQYLADIAACERRLLDGESYELCLTNTIAAESTSTHSLSIWSCAGSIRLRSPPTCGSASSPCSAPLPSASSASTATGGRRRSRSRAPPARRQTPARTRAWPARLRADEKNRAENLMIVDLLRNDLGAVCEVGSVEVPEPDGRSRATRPCTSWSPPCAAGCARTSSRRRLRPRLLPARLDDRRAEAAHDGDHRRARGRAPAASTPARSATSASAAAATSASRSGPSSSTARRRRSAPAARSSSTPIPTGVRGDAAEGLGAAAGDRSRGRPRVYILERTAPGGALCAAAGISPRLTS